MMQEAVPGIGATELEVLRREFRDFLTFLPDALIEVDLISRELTYANRMASILLGYEEDELTGMSGAAIVDEEGWNLALRVHAEHMMRLAKEGAPYQRTGRQDLFEVRMRRKDGTWFDAEVQGSYVLSEGGVPTRTRIIFRDVSSRKRAEAELRRSEGQLRQFAANAPVILAAIDREGVVTLLHGRMVASLGIDPDRVVGRSLDDFQLPESLLRLFRRGLSGEPAHGRFTISDYAFDVYVEPVIGEGGEHEGVVAVATDVSGIERAESALRQAQKMESLGLLASGVAHDFNNILTTILGITDLLKRADLGQEDKERLDVLERAAYRGADITRRLLAFARGGVETPKHIDLRDVLHDVARLAGPSLPKNVELDVDLPASPVPLYGDPGQLHQAVLNIVLNARDAITGAGRIRLTLRCDGDAAAIHIEDNGSGMDEETRSRLFEPFFTTKPKGAGTGLGLSIAYGVVHAHGGTISVQSRLGEGTAFAIRLPGAG